MNTNGNAKLKTTADGLRRMERRLPFVMAHMAVNWLYFMNGLVDVQNYCKKDGKDLNKFDRCRILF